MCPICNRPDCYREITHYWRYAVELFPEFEKEKIPVARFLCRERGETFSLLPVQLIPYFQYTVGAVIWTLLLALQYRQTGQQGCYRASIEVDPESLVTPWLITCWMTIVWQGLRRGHRTLVAFYDFSEIRVSQQTLPWKEVAGYFMAIGLRPQVPWNHTQEVVQGLLYRYSRSTAGFLFGLPSQLRFRR